MYHRYHSLGKEHPLTKERPLTKECPLTKERPLTKECPLTIERLLMKEHPLMKECPLTCCLECCMVSGLDFKVSVGFVVRYYFSNRGHRIIENKTWALFRD